MPSIALLQDYTDHPNSSSVAQDQKYAEGEISAHFQGVEFEFGKLPVTAVPDGAADEISLSLARCT